MTETKTVVKSKGFDFETIKPIVRINRNELIGKLYGLKGSEIVTIHTNTDARLRKTSKYDKTVKNPYPNVRKCSKVNGLFDVSYENCVNNQLAREGKEAEFKAEKPQWGESVNDSKTVVHHVNKDGEYGQYFNFNPRNHLETYYVDENGEKLDKADIEAFISDKKKSSRQGTDNEIIWRRYKIDSLIMASMQGKLFVII